MQISVVYVVLAKHYVVPRFRTRKFGTRYSWRSKANQDILVNAFTILLESDSVPSYHKQESCIIFAVQKEGMMRKTRYLQVGTMSFSASLAQRNHSTCTAVTGCTTWARRISDADASESPHILHFAFFNQRLQLPDQSYNQQQKPTKTNKQTDSIQR